ncbi:uncharacterized protein HMPREF1541_09770 [Cyphellophora europaea CBS 101466]|uniref:Pre-mRNA-processing factor 19 n=1 Tax=Cyphellophora europaea (strain CBS 101466) TaxID=1220924 RepID=W2S8F1_CYPE1|nr:uncharacterized protein HMPREF1541_09770 [Cyphellophora europaea CBS 101466]ETN44895.1 hypothetical protein HMPREF1541_09770 [Cyphellophora europaea CBS 101466]
MLCAISGEAPQVPVVSSKSGNVYEKRLIETYITENGTEPSTGESLTVDDLIDLKTPQSVRPRPPTLTSIPSLLSVFQEEWDALALETYTLRQNLTQTRQELSNALYQNDAAIRVIARLTKERDEAREALGKVNVAAPTNGDAMHVDSAPLPARVVEKIQTAQDSLSATRRKRPVPEEWATGESVATYTPKVMTQTQYPGGSALAVHQSGDLVLAGGVDGGVDVFSVARNQVVQSFTAGSGTITGAAWAGERAIISTSKGQVSVRDAASGSELGLFTAHTSGVSAVTVHPSGELFASVGADGIYVVYDIETMSVATQVASGGAFTCARFHPDGHLLAAGGPGGQIKVYDVKTGTEAAVFAFGSPLKQIIFSENGIWLAAIAENSTTISVWDIRKSTEIKALETNGVIASIDWDYTGQFLVSAGPSGITVNQYSKASKAWTEPLKLAVPATAVAWGKSAQSLLTLSSEGAITVLA